MVSINSEMNVDVDYIEKSGGYTAMICVLLIPGIGYFTLPYLVHAHASLVYACEWNPDAVEALKTNLALNGVAERCIVLEGDNRQVG